MIREPFQPRWIPQERWARERVDNLPAFVAREMLVRHAEMVGAVGDQSTSPFYIANQWLVEQERDLAVSRVWSAFDEAAVRDYAANYAHMCSNMPMLAERERFALRRGVEPPPAKFLSDRYEARAKRLADPLWWRRKLRVCWTRRAEEGIRRVGLVRKGKAPYVSDSAVNHRAAQKRNMRSYCESHVAVNELGEQLGLFDVQQGSVSNPALRRGELMTRVRGFEELADHRGDVALFFTLTVPSRYHPQLAAGGQNPSYVKSETARTAQAWLCKMWARARAAIHRKKVTLYGFRVAEPHHDGTPHWHGLFFVRPDAAHVVRDIVTRVWLSDAGDEPGARAYRVRVETIDKARGGAAGYISKYVSKNIDGHGSIGVASDLETEGSVIDSVVRVDAWASLHGIRQFQQIGGPTVGLWREARRVREEELKKADPDIARCCGAADRGSFYWFCRSVTFDGIGTRRSSLKLWKEETGEVSKYGEPRCTRTVGLRFGSACVITRPHKWKIERKGRSHAIGRSDPLPYGGIATPRNSQPGGASGSSSESPSALGPVAITVRVIPGSRTFIQGRWWEMTVAGQPGVPPYVPAREISDHMLQ